MRTVFRLMLTLFFLNLATGAYAEGISGTYVGKSINGAFLLQIVQTSEGRLTGHYEQITVRHGKLSEMNASITGASDGHTIALSLKPAEFLAGSLSLSGTVDGSTLRVTGGGYGSTVTLNLTKSSEADFQLMVSELKQQTELTDNRNAIKRALPRIENLTRRMTVVEQELPKYLGRFAPLERRYRAITERMRMGLARQRAVYCPNPSGYCEGQAQTARSQIAVAIQQAGIQASQLHISVQSSYSRFDIKSKADDGQLRKAATLCQTANTDVSDEALLGKWQMACRNLILAVPNYKKHVEQLRMAFAKAERVWKQEEAKQNEIVHSAFSTQ